MERQVFRLLGSGAVCPKVAFKDCLIGIFPQLRNILFEANPMFIFFLLIIALSTRAKFIKTSGKYLGYTRLRKVHKECNLSEPHDSHLKCLIIYLSLENADNNFDLENIQNQLGEDNEIKAYHKVYELGVKLSVL